MRHVKIQDAYLAGAAASQLQRAQQAQGPELAAEEPVHKAASPAADSIGISELSLRLLDLARGESPEHWTRLERLAAQIRSGHYQVDARELGRRLVEDALTRAS